jgi:hypothetical protein
LNAHQFGEETIVINLEPVTLYPEVKETDYRLCSMETGNTSSPPVCSGFSAKKKT